MLCRDVSTAATAIDALVHANVAGPGDYVLVCVDYQETPFLLICPCSCLHSPCPAQHSLIILGAKATLADVLLLCHAHDACTPACAGALLRDTGR